MKSGYLEIMPSQPLHGTVSLSGAKNAALVSIAALLLTSGKSRLQRVPASADVFNMIELLRELGAQVTFDPIAHELTVDSSSVNRWCVPAAMMQKMRASVLVMGPLLARFGRADIAIPGGCSIGVRPINYHLENFARMGAEIIQDGSHVYARADRLVARRIIL